MIKYFFIMIIISTAFLAGILSCNVPVYVPMITYLILISFGISLIKYCCGVKIIHVEKIVPKKSDRLEPPITDKYGKPWKRTTKKMRFRE